MCSGQSEVQSYAHICYGWCLHCQATYPHTDLVFNGRGEPFFSLPGDLSCPFCIVAWMGCSSPACWTSTLSSCIQTVSVVHFSPSWHAVWCCLLPNSGNNIFSDSLFVNEWKVFIFTSGRELQFVTPAFQDLVLRKQISYCRWENIFYGKSDIQSLLYTYE